MDDLIRKRSATDRMIIAMTLLESILQDMPTAEPRTGKWIPNNVVNAVCPWCCSECNSNQMDRTPYCKMCGARMEEEHAGE